MVSKCFHAAVLALGVQQFGESLQRLGLSRLFDDWLQYPPHYLRESIRGRKYSCANGDRIEVLIDYHIPEDDPQYPAQGLPRNKLSILWGGHPARPKHGTGVDTHPTRKFGMFFYLSVPQR
jgi:hypothetical protein